MASLFIDVLRSNVRAGKFIVHDFVVMPNHVHVLLSVPGDTSIEKAMQLVKGGFSFRAKRELGFRGEIWQRGFSDVRITDELSFRKHKDYIDNNPIKSGLANSPAEFPYGSAFLKREKVAKRNLPVGRDLEVVRSREGPPAAAKAEVKPRLVRHD